MKGKKSNDPIEKAKKTPPNGLAAKAVFTFQQTILEIRLMNRKFESIVLDKPLNVDPLLAMQSKHPLFYVGKREGVFFQEDIINHENAKIGVVVTISVKTFLL